jgi:hypothetical protein
LSSRHDRSEIVGHAHCSSPHHSRSRAGGRKKLITSSWRPLIPREGVISTPAIFAALNSSSASPSDWGDGARTKVFGTEPDSALETLDHPQAKGKSHNCLIPCWQSFSRPYFPVGNGKLWRDSQAIRQGLFGTPQIDVFGRATSWVSPVLISGETDLT